MQTLKINLLLCKFAYSRLILWAHYEVQLKWKLHSFRGLVVCVLKLKTDFYLHFYFINYGPCCIQGEKSIISAIPEN